MGNTCGSGRSSSYMGPSGSPSDRPDVSDVSVSNGIDGSDFDLSKAVESMQRYHRERLEYELENDLPTFILDNMLMCIQFFDNFDKAVEAGNDYRQRADREMTDLLAKDPTDGMILGDRRIKLLTGIPQILAQNYIYRGKHHSDDSEIDELYGGSDLKNTFLTEGLLNLEFLTTWENFELYEQKDTEDIKHYSDAKGASPVSRFCIEQPDISKEYRNGYVRLRCLDEPISERRPLNTPRASGSDFGYAHEPVYSKPYSDGIPEAHSESEEGAPSTGTTSEEDDDMLKFKETMKNMTSTSKVVSTNDMHASSKPGLTKRNLAKLQMASSEIDKKFENPNVIVHVSTPPVTQDDIFNPHSLPLQEGFLFPTSSKRLTHQQQFLSSQNQTTFQGKETPSSGYDTISSISVASSLMSEHQRDKWQRQNLKRLYDFGKRSRKEDIPPCGKYDPVPPDCYFKIKYEKPIDAPPSDADDQESEDSTSDEDNSDEDDSFSNQRSTKTKSIPEDDYTELRYYLHSLQFSSNACTEFQVVAPSLGIPDDSLQKGVVLGTSIRCQIPYTYPKDHPNEDDSKVGSYHMTYSFTPALHYKSWPENLFNKFRLQILGKLENRNVRSNWPTEEQLDKMEFLGCNAIPLGYRSVEFFNTEQILEWELNFHECEINLLDSFRSVHWRAYIYTSILFRAFIAPLGPLGVGHEHIRNILYFMCHEDFYGWNDEQPGLHLITIIGHLLHSLSRCYMPSFFLRDRNLMRSLPQQNLRLVQGHLNEVKENLIVYCIYAFRNLITVKKSDQSYPLPDLKDLFDILTASNGDLILMVNPIIKKHKEEEEKRKKEEQRERARSKKKKKQPVSLLDREAEIDRAFFNSEKQLNPRKEEDDPVQKRLERQYKRIQRRNEREKRKTREEKIKEEPEQRIPSAEKRHSIDLKKIPVIDNRGQPLRVQMLIKFFIEHFLKIADKAVDFRNFSLATTYVLQVENLTEIVQSGRYTQSSFLFTDTELEMYREETMRLRRAIGEDIGQYILSRVGTSHLSQSSQPRLYHEPNSPTDGYTFKNNWDLRKLPTPPPSVKESVSTKKLEKPNMLGSLQSFDNFPPANMPERLPRDSQRNVPRRQESFKFVENQVVPPATPPLRPRIASSTVSMSFDVDDEMESTDL